MVPIVLVRGLLRESGHWQDMADALVEALPELDIIMPNVPGNGELYQQLSPTRIEDMLAPVLAQLPNECERYHLVAISMGSMLASYWASILPGQVASLTLINPSFSRYSPFWQRINLGALTSIGVTSLKGSNAFQKSIIEWTSPASLHQPDVIEHHIRLARNHPVSARNATRQLWAAAHFEGQSTPPACPTQIIVSTEDKLVDSRCGEAIAQAWCVEIKRFECDAHDLPLAKPHALSHHLLHWLAKIELSVD
ncbi:alpha/beta fold hydrolase [Vibrio bivalvicida]|uniref:Hydrolase n=1 Tax=Vibrio bivalvicida TaxID=1276888 RepID=A0A177XUW1_9VIBR|nr:alpha/beta hydrolase [Vibrio bivalvicida]OAJ92423.1 hydrolase [Vibrio bivalvicida]